MSGSHLRALVSWAAEWSEQHAPATHIQTLGRLLGRALLEGGAALRTELAVLWRSVAQQAMNGAASAVRCCLFDFRFATVLCRLSVDMR